MSELAKQIRDMVGQVGSSWSAEERTAAYKGIINDVLVYLDAEPEVLAETVARVYIYSPDKVFAELGGGMVELDMFEGLRDDELLDVTITRREESHDATG